MNITIHKDRSSNNSFLFELNEVKNGLNELFIKVKYEYNDNGYMINPHIVFQKDGFDIDFNIIKYYTEDFYNFYRLNLSLSLSNRMRYDYIFPWDNISHFSWVLPFNNMTIDEFKNNINITIRYNSINYTNNYSFILREPKNKPDDQLVKVDYSYDTLGNMIDPHVESHVIGFNINYSIIGFYTKDFYNYINKQDYNFPWRKTQYNTWLLTPNMTRDDFNINRIKNSNIDKLTKNFLEIDYYNIVSDKELLTAKTEFEIKTKQYQKVLSIERNPDNKTAFAISGIKSVLDYSSVINPGFNPVEHVLQKFIVSKNKLDTDSVKYTLLDTINNISTDKYNKKFITVKTKKNDRGFNQMIDLFFQPPTLSTLELDIIDPQKTKILNTESQKKQLSILTTRDLMDSQIDLNYFKNYISTQRKNKKGFKQMTNDKGLNQMTDIKNTGAKNKLLSIATEMGLLNSQTEIAYFKKFDVNTQKKLLSKWVNVVLK